MDFVTSGTMTHDQEPKSIQYEIIDIDYWEQDAILVVEGERFYFQWDAKDHPTILDALRYFSNEVDSKYGINR
jgi:hypothetical protein